MVLLDAGTVNRDDLWEEMGMKGWRVDYGGHGHDAVLGCGIYLVYIYARNVSCWCGGRIRKALMNFDFMVTVNEEPRRVICDAHYNSEKQ